MSVLAIGLFSSVYAQNAVTADAPDAEQKAAATEMLLVMKMDTVLNEAVGLTLDQGIQANPALSKYRKVMMDFMIKYISWNAIKDDLATIYADEFTTQELKDLTTFYKTPTGQKAAEKIPLLMAKGSALGQTRVQENMAELQKAMADADKK